MPKVLNKKTANAKEAASAIYVGRPTKWGNPYTLGEHRTREQAIAYYEQYVLRRPKFVDEIRTELRGKDLLCFCSPLPCHADVLLRIANE